MARGATGRSPTTSMHAGERLLGVRNGCNAVLVWNCGGKLAWLAFHQQLTYMLMFAQHGSPFPLNHTTLTWHLGHQVISFATIPRFVYYRDLHGRRIRQVEAEKKLKEWAAQAKERELEKVAQQHIRDLARQQRQEKDYEVRGTGTVHAHVASG